MKTFATNLRESRKALGLSQKDLAELLNTTNSSICDWECERSEPNLETLVKLADILDITIDELLRK